MKEALRTDGNIAVWQAWTTTQNQLRQLRQPARNAVRRLDAQFDTAISLLLPMTILAQLHDCHTCYDERSNDQKKPSSAPFSLYPKSVKTT